jgi:hypothetical protein
MAGARIEVSAGLQQYDSISRSPCASHSTFPLNVRFEKQVCLDQGSTEIRIFDEGPYFCTADGQSSDSWVGWYRPEYQFF